MNDIDLSLRQLFYKPITGEEIEEMNKFAIKIYCNKDVNKLWNNVPLKSTKPYFRMKEMY